MSVMTASYTYSRPERVSEQARSKVLAAAARLGYAGPDPSARSLRRGRTQTLGVVMGEHLTYAFDDPQAVQFLAGVAEVCAGRALRHDHPADHGRRRRRRRGSPARRSTGSSSGPLGRRPGPGRRPRDEAARGGPRRPGPAGAGAGRIDNRAAARAVGDGRVRGARTGLPRCPSHSTALGDRPTATGPTRERGALRRHPAPTAAGSTEVRPPGWASTGCACPVVVLAGNDRAEAEAAALRLLDPDRRDGPDRDGRPGARRRPAGRRGRRDERRIALGVLAPPGASATDVPGAAGRHRLGRRRVGGSSRADDRAAVAAEQGDAPALVVEPGSATAGPTWQLVIRGSTSAVIARSTT